MPQLSSVWAQGLRNIRKTNLVCSQEKAKIKPTLSFVDGWKVFWNFICQTLSLLNGWLGVWDNGFCWPHLSTTTVSDSSSGNTAAYWGEVDVNKEQWQMWEQMWDLRVISQRTTEECWRIQTHRLIQCPSCIARIPGAWADAGDLSLFECELGVCVRACACNCA